MNPLYRAVLEYRLNQLCRQWRPDNRLQIEDSMRLILRLATRKVA